MKTILSHWTATFAVIAFCAGAGNATAQTISSTNGTSYPYLTGATGAQSNLPVNMSGYADWIYYIYGGESIVDGAASSFNPYLTFGTASTSSNSLGYGTGYQGGSLGANGDIPVTYTGGYQYNYTSNSSTPTVVGSGSGDDSKTNEGLYAKTPNGGTVGLQTITGSLTLTAATETFSFYLDENDAALNMAFTLTNPSTSVVTNYTANTVMTNGGGDNFSDYTVNITGAAAGDTLSWTESAASTGYNTTYGHIGIVAITEDPVPEPPVYCLMFGGLGLLWIGRRTLRLQR